MRGIVAGALIGLGAVGLTGEPAQARQQESLSTTTGPTTPPNLLDQLRQEVANTGTNQPPPATTPAPAPAVNSAPVTQPGAAAPSVEPAVVAPPAPAPVSFEAMTPEQRQAAGLDLMNQAVRFSASTVANESTNQKVIQPILNLVNGSGPVTDQQMNRIMAILQDSTAKWSADREVLQRQRAGAGSAGFFTDADLNQLNAQIADKRATMIAGLHDFLRGKIQIATFERIERSEAQARDPNRGGLVDRVAANVRVGVIDPIRDTVQDITTVAGHPASGPAIPRDERKANQQFVGANPIDSETQALLNRVRGNLSRLTVNRFDIMGSERDTYDFAASFVDRTGAYAPMTLEQMNSIAAGTLVPRASTPEALRDLNTSVETRSTAAEASRASIDQGLERIRGRLTDEQRSRFDAAFAGQQQVAAEVSNEFVRRNPNKFNLPAGPQTGDARQVLRSYMSGLLQQGSDEVNGFAAQCLDAVYERGEFAR